MNRTDGDYPIVYLNAGQMHCTNRPELIVTVLGSCLSVTMYSRKLQMGGICHGLLPSCSQKKGCNGGCTEELKYVECSIRRMIQIFAIEGAKRPEIEVKIFGGADLFIIRKIQKTGLLSVGQQNIQSAKMIIKDERLKLMTHDVGGLRGRKIFFYPHTGKVMLKLLSNPKYADLRWY